MFVQHLTMPKAFVYGRLRRARLGGEVFWGMFVENTDSRCRSYGSDRVILRLFLTFLALVRISDSGRLDNPYTPQGIISTTAKDYLNDRKEIFGRPKGDFGWQKPNFTL